MDRVALVHLSDIHFQKTSGKSVHDLDTNLRDELELDAKRIANNIGNLNGVLITGDIGFSGNKAEYDIATEWLRGFCRVISCPEENVWVVPGNHDVDRDLTKRKVTKTLHQSVRAESTDVDEELREILSDPQSADGLLQPLREYNEFASRFGCSVSATKHYWERDLRLSCGAIVRVRGLNSVLVSNAEDARPNLVLGTAQSAVARGPGVLHMTLCHHPPDWLKDMDLAEDHLGSKVHVQLFGHKHSQRLKLIDRNVRLVAGAMHPERRAKEWVPAYNVLVISRLSDDELALRVFQRRWDQATTRFVPERDAATGEEYKDFSWTGFPVVSDAEEPKPEEAMDSTTIKVGNKNTEGAHMSTANGVRRLTYRFLTLSFRHQIAVAQELDLLTNEDRALSDEALLRVLLVRASEGGMLARLWTETEKRHPDPANYNPFENS